MKIFQSIFIFISFFILNACSSSGSSTSAFTNEELDAIEAAQDFIRSEFAHDADFHKEGAIILPTEVDNRYKVMQRFDSAQKDGYNFVYRIWVQKFPSGWEYGNLGIERSGGERVLTTNGRMKELERQNMTRQENSSAGNVDYTIIKRNAPNYVRVYTAQRLTRDDVLTVYNQLKDTYQIVQFSTSSNPDDDEYMAIQYGSVYEHDKNKITKLAEY